MDQTSQTSNDWVSHKWLQKRFTAVAIAAFVGAFLSLGNGAYIAMLQSRVRSLESELREVGSRANSASNQGQVSRLNVEAVQTNARITKLEADIQEMGKKLK